MRENCTSSWTNNLRKDFLAWLGTSLQSTDGMELPLNMWTHWIWKT